MFMFHKKQMTSGLYIYTYSWSSFVTNETFRGRIKH